MYLNIDRQICVIKTVAYRARTDTQTHATRTGKKVKTEGPKMLSNHIVYFKTVIIGGPTHLYVSLKHISDSHIYLPETYHITHT